MLTLPPKPGDINAWLLWIMQSVQEMNKLARMEEIKAEDKARAKAIAARKEAKFNY